MNIRAATTVAKFFDDWIFLFFFFTFVRLVQQADNWEKVKWHLETNIPTQKLEYGRCKQRSECDS